MKKADEHRSIDYNKNHLVFYRHLPHVEQVFLNPSSCSQKAFKYLNHLNWKVSNENIKSEKFSHVLFAFDKDNIEGDQTWREIPKDESMLKRFDVSQYDLDNPLIFYDGVVSPMIHASVFALFCFLNNEEEYDSHFSYNRVEINESIRRV